MLNERMVELGTQRSVIRELQAEMKEQGYLVIEGRIPEEYLRKRFMLDGQETKGGKKK